MRALLLLTIFTGPLAADDAAKAIVAKAFKATGWDKRTVDNSTWKDKGKFTLQGQTMDYTGDFHVSFPDKYRFGIDMKTPGGDFQLKVVLNGDKAWETDGKATREITGDKLDYVKNELYQMVVLSLKPLLDDKGGFTLATIGEAQVADKKCVGVSVNKTGRPEVKLWFDAESGLPAKLACKVKNEFDGWKDATDEMTIGGWTDAGGEKVFQKMRIDRNGQVMLEAELRDLMHPDKVDPKLYEKP